MALLHSPRTAGSTPVPTADGATILTVYLLALLAIPAVLVVPALGTAGSPATIMAIGTFVYWIWNHMQRPERLPMSFQPLRAAVLLWLLVVLAAYVHDMIRPVPVDELTPADSGLLKAIGLSGIVLVATEGISSLERVRALARRLVLGVGCVAVLGLVQFVTKQLLVDRISIPGLSARGAEFGGNPRDGFVRVSGTSTHPIEFGVILTMVLPVLIVHAMYAERRRRLYQCLVAAVGVCILLVVGRSAILCGGVALVVLAMRWTWRARAVGLGCLMAVLVVVYVLVPGMLGVITHLFTGASEDPSVASRTGSYDVAWQFITRSPWLGRGFGTFTPDYWILDNAYLLVTIETGIVGLLALAVVIATGCASARRARRILHTDFDRELAHGVMAGILAGGAGIAFFDLFSFPQSAGCFFLLIGLAGALRRLAAQRAPAGHGAADLAAWRRRR